MGAFIDAKGQVFDRLTVVERLPSIKRRSKVRWLCRCSCGNTTVTTIDQLKSGHTRSCGCIHREQLSARNETHGLGRPKSYKTWANMLSRCRNPRASGYENYGGRGIKVCDRWRDFAAFYSDMGDPPLGKSIERKDVNGDYEPGNCVWAGAKEQARNTRRNILLTHDGRTMCLMDWAAEIGLRWEALYARFTRLGWTVEAALTRPPDKRKNRSHYGK